MSLDERDQMTADLKPGGSSGLSLETFVRQGPGLIEAQIDNEIVALNVDTGTCYGLNKVGARIWNLIRQPTRVRDIRDQLLTEFKVEPDICTQEVLELLEELSSEGLIIKSDKETL
jgi:hypothetical protein